MIDFKKLAENYKKDALNSLLEFLSINSVYDENSKDEENPYKVDYDFSQSVKAPINAGDVVGKIIVSKNGVVTKEIDLISRDSVEKLGYVDTLKKITEKW